MPTLTVGLAGTYSLSLRDNKVDRVNWKKIDGKNKLRRFFVHLRWQDYIARVSVSSGGAKGGVFFLEAYDVAYDEFDRQLQAGNVALTASALWRRLHLAGHLTGGMFTHGAPPPLPAILEAQVMRPAFTLTDTSFGKTVAARSAVLDALRNAARLRKRYVVKGTNEPGRTLFAEYLLNTIGRAKIPKSLVLEIDPNRPHNHADPSEGMVMLNLIDTLRNPGPDPARYNTAYANLNNGGQQVVDYLVVQKLLAGDMLADAGQLVDRVVEFLCDRKIIVGIDSFQSDPNFAGESQATLDFLLRELRQLGCLSNGLVAADYQTKLANLTTLATKRNHVADVLAAALPTLGRLGLDPRNYDKSPGRVFDQLVRDMQGQNTTLAQEVAALLATLQTLVTTNEQIFSDITMMRNTGRVHLADALLGNGDRFFQLNTGNVFYVWRDSTLEKTANPVGCIDNDSFLPTYLPSDLDGGFRNVANYVAKVLRPDAELWGWNSQKPPGMVMAPNMSMFDAFNYDRWLDDFFGGFISSDMPAVVLGMYGANFYAPGDSSPFDTTKDLPGWAHVRRGFKEGVAHALFNYLGTDIQEYRAVYTALAGRYYPGPNFEFTAFEIRDRYLRECQVDQQNWTVLPPVLPSSKALFTKYQDGVVKWLITEGIVDPECDDPRFSAIADGALLAGVQANHISAADEANIRGLLKTMAVSDQERMLPNPFAGMPIPNPTDKSRRAKFNKKLTGMEPKYARRMDVVICTLLRRFYNEYNAELGYLTHDKRRTLGSNAFKAAETLGQQVSDLKLATDELTTASRRTQVLGIDLDLVDHVFVK